MGCRVCGERRAACLDFHHRDPAGKNPVLVRRGDWKPQQWPNLGWTDLAAEIEKCDVICANCHRVHDASGYYAPSEVALTLPKIHSPKMEAAYAALGIELP